MAGRAARGPVDAARDVGPGLPRVATEAVRVGPRSVAFPAVSAGVYGWEGATVARVAVAAVRSAPELAHLDLVRFVLFSDRLLADFQAALTAD